MQRRVFALTMLGMLLSVLCALGDSDYKRRSEDPRTDAKRTYAALAQLPLAQRKLIFRNLPPDMKAALWVVHLQNFLHAHPDLDSNQRAIVNTAIALADPTSYDVSGSVTPDARELAARLEFAARLSFSHDLLGEAFYELGESNNSASIATETTFRQGTIMASDTDPAILDDCTCSHDHDWCANGQCSNYGCKPVAAGCGFMWWFACDGFCPS